MSKLDVFLWLNLKCYHEVSTKRYWQIQRCQTNKSTKKIHLWEKKKAWKRTQMPFTLTEGLAVTIRVKTIGCFCRGAPSCLMAFWMWLCLRKFPPLGLHKRILNSLCLLILLIHTKHKTIRRNFGLSLCFYSLEGELIHWIDEAKNLWITVGQLLQYFSHKLTVPIFRVTQENAELPLPNSLYSHQTQNNTMKSWTDSTSSFPWRRRTHQLGR